jgi:hypothetical protein
VKKNPGVKSLHFVQPVALKVHYFKVSGLSSRTRLLDKLGQDFSPGNSMERERITRTAEELLDNLIPFG